MSDTKIAPEYSQDRALGNLELAVVVPNGEAGPKPSEFCPNATFSAPA